MNLEIPKRDVIRPKRQHNDGVIKPTFLIVGAAKCGTTSLAAYLRQHPQVFLPKWKEPGYFSSQVPDRPQSEEAYLSLFKTAVGKQAIGEASTAYLFDRDAPRKIREMLGPIHILILLRNPVDACFSLWVHNHRKGIENRPFRDALAANTSPVNVARGVPEFRFQYQDRYRYAEQVTRYLQYFPVERIYIGIFEEFFADVRASFANVCRFLEVFDYVPDDLRAHNPGSDGHPLVKWAMRNRRWLRSGIRPFTSKAMRLSFMEKLEHINVRGSKPALDDSIRAELSEIFAPDIERMEVLLGRKLPAWKATFK